MHCHDWPTAPVTYAGIGDAKAVFTIHNLNYGQDLIGRAMQASSVGTTVSPTYATEVGRPAAPLGPLDFMMPAGMTLPVCQSQPCNSCMEAIHTVLD